MGAFVAGLNPTVDELADLKTAVSEAVTNCIIHGYEQQEGKIFFIFHTCLNQHLHPSPMVLRIITLVPFLGSETTSAGMIWKICFRWEALD